MAQNEWDGGHAVYARGPQAREAFHQGGQQVYGQPPQYYQPQGMHAEPAAAGIDLGAILARATGLAGAVLSLGLIAGAGIWGYKLAMRDVTGVPVVRALAGPMRVAPEDPGGLSVAHQGLAVNEIAAEGTAAGPVEQVTLAPAAAALDPDDMPADTGADATAVLAAEAGEVPVTAEAGDETTLAAADPGETADPTASALAMADALAAASAPLSGDEADIDMTPEAQAALDAALASAGGAAAVPAVPVIPASVPGVARSPRPPSRPAGLALPVGVVARGDSADLHALTPVSAAPAVREVAAAEIPSGTRLVQLGAYDSEDVARNEWTGLAERFEEVMDGKARVIEQAQSGGKTFYRLRAMGFDDLSDARRFCAALMAGQAPCIPVVTR